MSFSEIAPFHWSAWTMYNNIDMWLLWRLSPRITSIEWLHLEKISKLSVMVCAQAICWLRISWSHCHIEIRVRIHHVCKPLCGWLTFPTWTWFSKLEGFHMIWQRVNRWCKFSIKYNGGVTRPILSQFATFKACLWGRNMGFFVS